MEKQFKVGIVGYGVIGARRHLYCDKHPLLQVTAVCDQKFDTTTTVADNVIAYPTPAQLLEEELDILFVCVPNDIAPDATIAGLQAGHHVFCEKPPGRTVQDIIRVRDVEAMYPKQKLKYGFNHRYHESVKAAKDLIESGGLGEIINLRGVYGKSAFIRWPRPHVGTAESTDIKHWRTSRQIAGGGILLDQGIHMVDLMLSFANEPFTQIASFVDNNFWKHDVEDNAYALMRSSSGSVAILHSSATLWRHNFNLEISLTQGCLKLSGILTGTKSYGEEKLTVIHRKDEANGLPSESITTYVTDNSWSEEIDDFVTSIVNDTPIVVGNSEAALASMDTVHRIYQADPQWRGRTWEKTDEEKRCNLTLVAR